MSTQRSSPDSATALPTAPDGRTGWPFSMSPETSAVDVGGARPDRDWPRISIVIPSFNQGAFLEEALRSVLLQGYPDLEVLVFDGGSSDETVSVLERYDEHLAYWVSAPDGGQSDAINRGFERATGEIVTFFGSDDLYLPRAFVDVARRFVDEPEAGAVVGAFRFMDERSRFADEIHPPRLPNGLADRLADRLPGQETIDLSLAHPSSWRLHQVATFYRASALDAVGREVREELRYTMDRELLWRVGRRFPIVLAESVYAGFRRHSTSKSVSEILPFCFEMADLHLMTPQSAGNEETEKTEGPMERSLRTRWARFWRSRGHLKVAEATESRSAAIRALVSALGHRPSLLTSHGYLRLWRQALAPGFAGRPKSR